MEIDFRNPDAVRPYLGRKVVVKHLFGCPEPEVITLKTLDKKAYGPENPVTGQRRMRDIVTYTNETGHGYFSYLDDFLSMTEPKREADCHVYDETDGHLFTFTCDPADTPNEGEIIEHEVHGNWVVYGKLTYQSGRIDYHVRPKTE